MSRHPLAARPIVPLTRLARPQNHPRSSALFLPAARDQEPAGELARDAALAAVEAALFLAEEPLAPRKLAVVAGLPDAATARRLIDRLHELYDKDGSAFALEELAGGWQLLTRPGFHPWLSRLRKGVAQQEVQLSAAAREALTIIAYRQPVTRADLEAIRGVGSGDVLKALMERGLVRLAGRDNSLGRPALYETTKKFLQLFGLRSLKDLPPGEGLFPDRSS